VNEKQEKIKREIKKLGDLIDTVLIEHNSVEQRTYPQTPSMGYTRDFKPDLFDGLEVEWEIGGSEGGNYKSGDSHPYSTNAPPEELTSLFIVVDALFPDISFREGSQLLNSIVTDKYQVREYYGNYQEFMRKRISIKDIHQWMERYNLTPRDSTCAPSL
jgi:hypothetical protein